MRTQSNILRTLRGAEARSRVAGILSRESFASRQSLGRRVCEEFAFVDALGRWQVSGCLKALRTLAASSPEIVLPPPRVPPPDRTPRQLDEAVPAPVGVPGRVSEIEGLEVFPVTTVVQRTVWNTLIAREHPHGLTTFAGHQVRYLVTSGHGILGAAGFSAAALQVQARDRWIGWSAPQRRDHLHRVIGLSRFLIRPAVRCPHLASQVLGRLLRRLPADFEARYGLRVWLVESYADAGVPGTCLRAANFVCVGETKGRGRQDRYHRREKTGKTVWMYPLHRRWRRDLGVAEVERWPSLEPGEGLGAREWAANELGGAPLGDRRRAARLVKSASLLAEYPGQKIQAHPDSSRTVISAFYRLIEQPVDSAITVDNILAPHRERTLQRIRGQRTVLAIEDGSDLNFARRPGCDGLQVIGTNQTRASTLHATLAVTDTGLPLGVLRLGFDPKHAKTVAAGTKSRRWLHGFTDTVDAVREVGGKTRVIMVCDREADFFELFDLQRQHPRVEVLVRARHDRVLGPHRPKLFAAMQAGPSDDQIEIEIDGLTERRKSRGKPARRKRVANCELRHRRLTLPSTLEGKDPVSVSTVHLVETHPPEGENPVQWFLLTTLPVRTGPQAAEVVGHYLQRWKIEDFFRVLKSGCQVQSLLFRKAERLQRVTAIHAVIAWRIMVLTLLGRQVPDCEPALMFTDPELAFLRDYAREQAMPAPDTLGGAVRLVAHLGGYRDRKHDPEPGYQIMWHGSNRLSGATLGHRIGFQAGQRQALVRDRAPLVQP